MIKAAPRNYSQWMFWAYPISAEALGLYRIAYALFFLIWGLPNFEWAGQAVPSFFHPQEYSLARLFGGLPPYWATQGLSISVVVLFVMLLFGWHTRKVSITLFVVIVLGKSISFSFGQIGKDLMLWLIPLVMSFSNWGNKYSIDANRKEQAANAPVQSWPVAMMAMLLAFGMLTAALPKLLNGWLHIGTHATRGHLLVQHYVVGNLLLLGPWLTSLRSGWLWEIMDWGAVFFELAFVIAFFKRQWLRSVLLAALVFHTFAFLMFDISYYTHYVLYLLFIDWGMMPAWLYARLAHFAQRVLTLKWLFLTLCAYMPLYLWAQQVLEMPALLDATPFFIPPALLGWKHEIVMGATALPLAYAIAAWQLKGSFAKPKRANKTLIST